MPDTLLRCMSFLLLGLLLFPGGAGCGDSDDDDDGDPPVVLALSTGFWNKTHVECSAAQSDVPLLHLFLSVGPGDPVLFERITFRATGSLDDLSDVAGMVLALDTNGDGEYQLGSDTALTAAPGTFSADNGTVTFVVNRTLQPNSSESWVLSGDLIGTALDSETLTVTLAENGDVSLKDGPTGAPRGVSGLPLSGPEVTVKAPAPAWANVGPAGTSPLRYAHTTVFDAPNNRLVVYGGTDGTVSYSAVHTLDCTAGSENWSLLTVGGSPPPTRNQHGAFYDSAQSRMIIFGGANAVNLYNDVWFLSLTSSFEAWSAPAVSGTPPSARYAACFVFDSTLNRALVTGGNGGGTVNPHLSDGFALDLSGPTPAWSPLFDNSTIGYSQSGHVAFFDAPENRVVQFAGLINPNTPTTLLYSLDLDYNPAALATLTVEGSPKPAAWSASAWNTADGRFYVFGGYNEPQAQAYSSLYAFDPSLPWPGRWIYIMVPGTGPSARCFAAMSYDSVQERLLLHGGAYRLTTGSWLPLSDTWAFE